MQDPDRFETLDLDDIPANADWTKRAWNLPYFDVDSLRAGLDADGVDVETFKTLPIYRYNAGTPGFEWLEAL